MVGNVDSISIVGEIVAAASAFAGLILVYLGALAAGYSAYQRQEKISVRPAYSARAWRAFGGMSLALFSVVTAVVAKGTNTEWLADLSALLLLLAFASAVWIAYETAGEIV